MGAGLPPSAFEGLLGQLSESVAVYDHDAQIVYVNSAAERSLGAPLAALAGKRLWDLAAYERTFREAFERVVASGERVELEHPCATKKWWSSRISRDGDRVVVVSREVTLQRAGSRRTEALARISEVLTADDADFATVTSTFARILTDIMDADCSLAMLSADRAWLELAASSSRDPKAYAATKKVTRFPADLGQPGEALRERRAVLAQATEIETEAAKLRDPAILEASRQYRATSLVVVPLVAGDEPIGIMMALRRCEQPPLTEEDKQLATELSATIGLYLAHVRRRTEAAWLRTRLAAVTDSNPALVSIIDRDRRYLYVNASYERWFGRPREAFLGKTIDEVSGPAVAATIAPYFERGLAGEEVHYKASIPYPSGSRFVDARYVPIRGESGAVESCAALIVDLTAEQLLDEAEQHRLEDAHRATRRLESLLALTGRLAGASREDEIAQILVDEGVSILDATMGGLWIARPDGMFEMLRERNFPRAHVPTFKWLEPTPGTPLGDCVLSGRPLWIESRADYHAQYPDIEPRYRPEPVVPLALGIVPLVSEGRVIGCSSFTFHDERRLTRDDRAYLELLVSHGAQAFRRARLYSELADASETRKAIIQALPAATFLVDERGIVHAWNPAAERIFGWTAAEAIGRFLPWAAPERRQAIEANLREVLDGKPLHDARVRWPNRAGEQLDIELYAVAVRTSDGQSRCLAMAFDISERTRFERGRELVANASAILNRSLDVDETLHQIMKLPLEHFGDWCAVDLCAPDGTLDRLVVQGKEMLAFVPPRKLQHSGTYEGSSRAIATRAPRLLRDVDDEMRRKIARDEEHFEALKKTGLRSSLSVPLLVGDRVLGALNVASKSRNLDEIDVQIFTDIANRAAAAIENARLYASAQQARRDAEAADQAKDQFLAMLGHELRNPLAPIVTALHLMKMRHPEIAERERGIIDRQIKHLTRLVDDLLDISRITRGKVELQRERVPVGVALARAIEISSPLFEQRRHRLSLDIPQDLVIDGDPLRLDQVFANLLSNAAKYTEPGGQIRVVARQDGDRAVIVVEDTGVGIAPEMLPNVFDVFVQAPQQAARTQGGLGLGLAIVKSIVELHGGSVAAHSDGMGHGTAIEVRLPAVSGSAEVAKSALPIATQRAGRRILVVDDNRDAAQMLSEVLDSYGHEIRTAYDGLTALELAAELRPEIAILDIGLPVMDGYELAERLRAMAPLRLIAVTGYGQPSDKERARAAGFEAHIAKPVTVERLLELLEA